MRKSNNSIRYESRAGSISVTLLTWFLGLLFFFPIFWIGLISVRQEVDAGTFPPKWTAPFTLGNYGEVFTAGAKNFLLNSVIASLLSTIIVLMLAYPAAYALSIKPIKKSKDVLAFFLSTKFLPPIAALLPLYLILQKIHLLDNIFALAVLYIAMNLPLSVWMLRSFLKEIPKDLVEAAELDGASTVKILYKVLAPISMPGIAATALICFIFTWNEFLLAINVTGFGAATAPVYLVGFVTAEGLFFAHLAAVSIVVSLPVVIAGWAAQDKLVRGLSLGAVK
ncbi:MAG: carbohydrate ABC transporter permease [Streptomycetaceae bacterium]|nr:MAG: carbohydrate ABC transporter permease [Streptomycetaceae bacterium]